MVCGPGSSYKTCGAEANFGGYRPLSPYVAPPLVATSFSTFSYPVFYMTLSSDDAMRAKQLIIAQADYQQSITMVTVVTSLIT